MISHQHKCIFVHIPRTAGQSIEHVFLRSLGLTWETRAPLLLRPNDRPELGPPRLAHLKARDYVKFKYISQDLFGSYFKFTFVRNPWDRLVSLYRYLGFAQRSSYKQFLAHHLPHLWDDMHWFIGPQVGFIYSGDHCLVDFVGTFEQLNEDFAFICQRLQMKPHKLPHVNQKKRGSSTTPSGLSLLERLRGRRSVTDAIGSHSTPTFRDYYDSNTRAFVEDLYRDDIQAFGYSFDADSRQ